MESFFPIYTSTPILGASVAHESRLLLKAIRGKASCACAFLLLNGRSASSVHVINCNNFIILRVLLNMLQSYGKAS